MTASFENTGILVLLPILLPLVAAALAALFWQNVRAQKIITQAFLVALFGASVLLLMQVSTGSIEVKQLGSWAAPFGISLVADRLSAAMVMISAILALAIGFFANGDITRNEERGGFFPLFSGLLVGVNGSFLTGDIFNLYVWFEVMLICSLGLLVVGGRKSQMDGAFKYIALNLLGTIVFLIAVGILYGVTGTLNMADLAVRLPNMEMSPALMTSAVMFLLAFGIKAGIFPLFFWLPASYHTAPITISAIFAGLLTKVGVYAAIRVFTLMYDLDEGGMTTLMAWIAAATMVTGVLGAAVQWDVRRILSFHIISQIGYMLLGLAVYTPIAIAGAVFYVVHHIIVKANLFLVAGAIYKSTGSYDLRQSGGLMKAQPLLAVLFAIPALSLAGLPPLSGFWAKFMVIDATFEGGLGWLAGVALAVGLLTLFSMSKIWLEAFWKKAPEGAPAPQRLGASTLVPIAALGAITLAIGLMAEPLVEFANLAAADLVSPDNYVAAVLGPEPGVELAANGSEN